MARSTPICWRRSTTARRLMTPSAATPTMRPQGHVAGEDAVEGPVGGCVLLDLLRQHYRLHAVLLEGGLETPGRRRLVHAVGHAEAVGGQRDREGHGVVELRLRHQHADAQLAEGVRELVQDADDGQRGRRLRAGLADLDGDGGHRLVLVEEALQPEGDLAALEPAAFAGHDQRVHHDQGGVPPAMARHTSCSVGP